MFGIIHQQPLTAQLSFHEGGLGVPRVENSGLVPSTCGTSEGGRQLLMVRGRRDGKAEVAAP